MVAIPDPIDPTLAAIDRALEASAARSPGRAYLGMSAIGHSCERALWYGFRWAGSAKFNAATLKRFADGHHGEDVMATRLRMVEGVTLLTIDPETGQQYEFTDHDGHFRGHFDGAVVGLLQAPKAWHVWEHKQTDDKKLAKLDKLKRELGEKNALREWNPVYYAQAVLYMAYAGLDRHYMTVSSPGGRHTTSCRTEADPAAAEATRTRAERIIRADRAPPRISDDPAWYECKWCDHYAVCHQGAPAKSNCRTCLHASPAADGAWHCARFDRLLSRDEQRTGCRDHLYLPSLIDGEQTDAAEDGSWVEYRMRDGSIWRNEIAR